MVTEMDEGRIGTIIVKDMSRLGRDYLKVGYYTEVAFPNADICFIAVSNGVDSANQQDSDFTPFLNIINDIYYISTVFIYRPITIKTAHSRIATRATVVGGFIV